MVGYPRQLRPRGTRLLVAGSATAGASLLVGALGIALGAWMQSGLVVAAFVFPGFFGLIGGIIAVVVGVVQRSRGGEPRAVNVKSVARTAAATPVAAAAFLFIAAILMERS